MSDKIFGAAIQGAGWVSTQHVKAYLNNSHTKLVGISSRREESAKKLAEMYDLKDVKTYTNYDRMLEDPNVDIVSICTPHHLHSQEVVKAAEAKKHVVIEKPVAISLEQLKAMRDAVRRSRVKSIVSVVARWNPIVRTIKSLAADDVFGSVYYVETNYQSRLDSWWPGWEWGRKKEIGVSSMLVAGVHALDLSRWFAETKPDRAARIVEVFSYAGGYRKNKTLPPFEYDSIRYTGRSAKGTTAAPMEYDGLEVMLTKFDNGALGKTACNYDVVMPYNFTWEVFGDKGTCKNNRVWSQSFPGQNDWVTIPGIMLDTAEVGHHPFQDEIDEIVDCIIKDKESPSNLDDAVNPHEAALAAMISQKEGRPVKLPLI